MAWDEWERTKSEALARHSAHTQLDSAAGPSGGGSSGKLRSSKAAWARAGHEVGSLRDHIGRAKTRLEDGQEGFGDDAGCLTATAQREVYSSWQRYVKKVDDRCGKLAGIMEKVGSEVLKEEHAIKDEIAKLRTEYRDTPAGGDRPQGG